MRGFEQHGVTIVNPDAGDNAIGDCPFCGRDAKFYVHKTELVWDCKVCGLSGNFTQFLARVADAYRPNLTGDALDALCKSRGLRPQTLRAWRVGWSGAFYSIPTTGNAKREVTDIRRYRIGSKAMSTTGAHPCLITAAELTDSPRVWLCEGEWDGQAWWECLRRNKVTDDVFATPGALTFPAVSLSLFQGRDVVVMYDNDEAGRKGEEKVLKALKGVARSLVFVHWPADLREGFDTRDWYVQHGKDALDAIKPLLYDKPRSETGAKAVGTLKKPPVKRTQTPLEARWVFDRYRKWLHLETPRALEVMFGVVFANRIPGDPLWLFFVAPPGGMKSALIMSIGNADDVVSVTSLTPHALVSGASLAGGGDPSLIPELNGKILAIKDFTPILSMNSLARDDIFSVLRDIYDGHLTKRFGSGGGGVVVRHYESHFGILAGVTPAVETLSAANVSLGERFLKYKLPKGGTDKLVIARALSNIHNDDQMKHDLAEIGEQVLAQTFDTFPRVPVDMLNKLVELAQWVACLRGVVNREKYTGMVNYKPMSEVGTRLAKQLCKLAIGVAMFKHEEEVTEETYVTVVKTAQDTVPDRVEEIVKQLFIRGYRYHPTKDIAQAARFPEDTTRYILQDLALLGVAKKEAGLAGGWRLSQTTYNLMRRLGLYTEEVAWLAQSQE